MKSEAKRRSRRKVSCETSEFVGRSEFETRQIPPADEAEPSPPEDRAKTSEVLSADEAAAKI